MIKPLLAAAFVACPALSAMASDNPWVGLWTPDPARSTFVEANDSLVISAPSEGRLRWIYPLMKFEMEGKTDGSDKNIAYPGKPANLTESVTMLSSRKLACSVKVDGKLVQQGTDEVSADGRTLTAVSWTLGTPAGGKESEKRIEVFDKR
jgi:hypothetical protein